MAGFVGERLPDDRQEALGGVIGDRGVDRPLGVEPRPEARALGSPGHSRQHLRAQAGRPVSPVLEPTERRVGADGGTRTPDQSLTRRSLCHLSYVGALQIIGLHGLRLFILGPAA